MELEKIIAIGIVISGLVLGNWCIIRNIYWIKMDKKFREGN